MLQIIWQSGGWAIVYSPKPLHVVTGGSDALDYLHQRGGYVDAPRPDIVLLDLNLPGMSGIEVLDEMENGTDLRRIPVIILTSSQSEEDIVNSYDKYANAYLRKPVNPDEFVDIARSIGEFWIQTVELPTTT